MLLYTKIINRRTLHRDGVSSTVGAGFLGDRIQHDYVLYEYIFFARLLDIDESKSLESSTESSLFEFFGLADRSSGIRLP